MKFDQLADETKLNAVAASLKEHGYLPQVVKNKAEALEKIKALIPADATVMNGSSRTLEEIGFMEYFGSENHPWKNLHAPIWAEKDPVKQQQLRNQALVAEYYVGSVHALTEDGEMVIASNSGSQLPHLVFTSPNIILVVGAQKVVKNVDEGLERLKDYVFDLEDARMKEKYGYGSIIAKILILNRENTAIGRNVHVLMVEEKLGF